MRTKGRVERCYIVLMVSTAIFLVSFFPSYSFAGGAQHYPLGAEAFLIGIGPPPGFYIKEYNSFYTADKIKNDSGHALSLAKDGFVLDKLNVYGITTRLVWVSPFKILDGFYAQNLFIPLLNLDMKVTQLGPNGPVKVSEHRQALGDIRYTPFALLWHSNDGLLHYATSLSIDFPNGPYNERHLVNIGKNCWTFEPCFIITGFLPQDKNLSASIHLRYSFNTKNPDFLIDSSTAAKIGNPALTGKTTHLTPGQEFHFDYSIEYAIAKTGPANQARVGIVGYFYQQTTDDTTGQGSVKNDLGRVFAIGPGVGYTYKKWIFDLHAAYEMGVRNRPEGRTGLFTIVYAF